MVKRVEVLHGEFPLGADMVCCRSTVLDAVSTI
jgi:hypothetical protein